jgi:P4 family phage/plasmid primase-like protien
MSEKIMNQNNNNTLDYVYIKLSEFLADNAVEAEIETVIGVYKEQYTEGLDPIAFWGIECDSSPELRKITVKAEILRGIDIIAEIVKEEEPKTLESFFGEEWNVPEVKTKGKTKGKKSKKADIPEWIKEVRKNLFSTNREGHVEIEWELLEAKIRSTFIFKTVRETREIFYYNKGVYLPAKTTIEAWLKEVLGVYADWRLVRKVEDWIRYATYTDLEEFDAEKDYIPLKNGLMHITTGEMEDFDSEKLFTSGLPVEYDIDASSKDIEDFMGEVLHSEDISVMQELFGYTLYLGYPSAKLFWFGAPGSNGKTTVIALLSAMLGKDNVAGIGLHEMDGHHRFALAGLHGCRLNDMAEAETRFIVETPTLKRATGGDLLSTEKKGIQKRFKFVNYAKFVVSANRVPRIDDNTPAMERRLLVIDFPNSFTGSDEKMDYAKNFIGKHGLAGIFNWAFEGLQRLYNNGWQFTPSKWQVRAKEDMMRQAHPVTSFLAEWTKFSSSAFLGKNILYEGYENYCNQYNIVGMDENIFTREVKRQNGVMLVRNQGIKGRPTQWRGICFKPYIEDSIIRARTEAALDIEMPLHSQDKKDSKDYEEVLKT